MRNVAIQQARWTSCSFLPVLKAVQNEIGQRSRFYSEFGASQCIVVSGLDRPSPHHNERYGCPLAICPLTSLLISLGMLCMCDAAKRQEQPPPTPAMPCWVRARWRIPGRPSALLPCRSCSKLSESAIEMEPRPWQAPSIDGLGRTRICFPLMMPPLPRCVTRNSWEDVP